MVHLVFFEKPGCINNTRQKQLLQASGHEVVACNLLTEPWTVERLRLFFGDLPLLQWFNPAAPRIKQGEVVPDKLTESEALLLMQQDPLLIRRPLMQAAGGYMAGFDPEKVRAWIGLDQPEDDTDLQACPNSHK